MYELNKREKELLLLSVLWCYTQKQSRDDLCRIFDKHQKGEINDKEFEENVKSIPRVNDITNDFVTKITKDGWIRECFSNLTDYEISGFLRIFADLFANQESCAQCESWSYYDITDPAIFAIKVVADMFGCMNGFSGSKFYLIPCLEEERNHDKRFEIIFCVIKEYKDKLVSFDHSETWPTRYLI